MGIGAWGRRAGVAVLCALAAVLASAGLAPRARAANRLYWANYDGESLAYTDLDGSGSGALDAQGATMDGPMGIALNPAHGQIYWANWGANGSGTGSTISVANLDGSGEASTLPINPAYVKGPHGLAIDPVAGKLYWPNFGDSTIGFANLDGSGAGHLNTGLATINGPRGVAIDPVGRRIYWANYGVAGAGTTISWANLDGGGGGTLITLSAANEGPEGVALDPANNRIYWGIFGPTDAGSTIGWANLDGSGGPHALGTPGVTKQGVHGVALDPLGGRIYWPNYIPGAGTLASAAVDGSGASFLPVNLLQTSVDGPVLPNLLFKPVGTGAPAVSGEAAVGSTLSCSEGSWAGDLGASLLYRAPQRFAYSWTLDGQPIAGANAATLTAGSVGGYRCAVTATNVAGGTSQTSTAFTVGPSNEFKLGKAKLNKHKGTATLKVTVPGPGKLSVGGGKVKAASKRVSTPKATLPIRARGKAKAKLADKGHVTVKAAITFRPTGGAARTQRKKLKLVER